MGESEHNVFILESLRNLCQKDEKCRKRCRRFLDYEKLSRSAYEAVLGDLSCLLCLPSCTENVVYFFPQILLELLSLARDSEMEDEEIHHRRMCAVLGKTILVHPDAVRFCLQYFEDHPPPFGCTDSSDETPVKKKKLMSKYENDVSDLDIVVACYNFLMMSCEHFRVIWDWSSFMNLFCEHKDELVSWIACQCIRLVCGIGHTESEAIPSKFWTSKSISGCSLKFEEMQMNLIEKMTGNHRVSLPKETVTSAFSPSVVNVAGIQLPMLNSKKGDAGFLVPVASTFSNLHSLALGVASSKAICLQGPVGCGKTALVEHLAHLTGRAIPPLFIKVQLGDETDSKMLLGTYRCTDVPGEFVWQSGVLTQAAVEGHWLLLEDIDTATMDVASVLAGLLETRSLTVPGYKDNVKVAPGFQLFVTQRLLPAVSGFQRISSNASNLLDKHWLQVNVEPLSRSELVEVVQELFPVLRTIASRIVKVFLLFSSGVHHSALNATEEPEDSGGPTVESKVVDINSRLTSTRDLLKWCKRAVVGFDVTKQESALKVFQDAIDIFCCSVPDPDARLRLATSIGNCLGIVKTKAEFFCLSYKPVIQASPESFTAGTTVLKKQEESAVQLYPASRFRFSFTRPAACLLERVARCVSGQEPVLLVGETGTGKTSVVQFLAEHTRNRLLVINMNQQSDSSDLLGGYKPMDLRFIVAPVREEFETLFRSYFCVPANLKFLENLAACYANRRWLLLLRMMKQSQKAAMERLRKTPKEKNRLEAWAALGQRLHKLEMQTKAQSALAFSFVEGSLVRALKEGYWVLLDEINLASAETLQCLSGLLEGSSESIYLLERGDREPIRRHPNFHLFACMNPATDVGKKDLPAGLRNRFTEFFVEELTEWSDLLLLVGTYLKDLSLPQTVHEKLVKFYLNVREAALKKLNDGTGRKPHYSLRTLCRALSVAASNPCGAVLRSLYEGLCLSFLTQLDHVSHPVVMKMISEAVFGKEKKSILSQKILPPSTSGSKKYVEFEGYWVLQGSLEPVVPDKYILTPSVRRNLHDLVRVVAIGRHPVLLQGETSVGKTSLITYLAKASGNLCVRINNHEHTDIQEYIGSYSADKDGRLIFREGVLVEAMRKGHWIILDELNLAPTDVLEALNRVLDDNRELFIPETQETVRADPRFMLFATQNPSGLYGGRKVLSRAFRNRFVELHFAEIPPKELETILEKRCDMPASYCKKLVAVMTELQLRRRGSAAFAGKQGFMTLRDLFRWGERYTKAGSQPTGVKFYDWDQHLADEGYLVLAGRVRKEEEAAVIQETLQKHLKRAVDPEKLFSLGESTSSVTRKILEAIITKPVPSFEHIVWTYNMRRLAVLVGKSFEFREPVLLVGETGCGKTTICQLLAAMKGQELFCVNCHMHTEGADFLGGLRPVRIHNTAEEPHRLFEWVDGPLVKAMLLGGLFLADEISLADDSVLERLNSLLEPERTLLLAEKGLGGPNADSSLVVVAQENFHFVGTMNPGGDYGKKELSPALRNRFTEVWCQSCTLREDRIAIIEHNLVSGVAVPNAKEGTSGVGTLMMDFIEWFSSTEIGKRFPVSIRDILSWVNFINVMIKQGVDLSLAYVHGASLTFLDSFGSGVTSIERLSTLRTFHNICLRFLNNQVQVTGSDVHEQTEVTVTKSHFGIHPFFIDLGTVPVQPSDFTFSAPTTRLNALRVLRAMQLPKPILLEGSPGVGKTTLIAALAKASGHGLTRINLSEQTDISDLFGADLPVEGGIGGLFAWRDGPLLRALKAGHWILLDELNLASQSVLEGLNACLDHRGEVFIPELGRSFQVKPGRTHLFGAQNPLRQGGARKGLPQSFLNRFTQVYIDSLSDADLEFILCTVYPVVPQSLVQKLVSFNRRLVHETGELRLWGLRGGPWELNLRDLSRWCQAMTRPQRACPLGQSLNQKESMNPGQFVDLIYMDRMRTPEDREKVRPVYYEEFGEEYPLSCEVPLVHVSKDAVFLGDEILTRWDGYVKSESKENVPLPPPCPIPPEQSLLLLRHQYKPLRSLARCVNMNWMAMLVGPSGSGKTSLVRLLAQLTGKELNVLTVNSAMDTTEILGGFEQADVGRRVEALTERAERLLLGAARQEAGRGGTGGLADALRRLHALRPPARRRPAHEWEECDRLQAGLRRLRRLRQAVEGPLLDGDFASERDALLREAEDVGSRAASAPGGTFEWVDSLLVKCVREGSWLLLDGANLCSAAVLDRLNALLEPGGALALGERGVDAATGEVPLVAPHPAFRLFLAMDPHHGDISRAMRNRGVEIFVESPAEPAGGGLDAAALLGARGLRRPCERRALLAAHAAAAHHWPLSEPPGLSHLLSAAFLAGQRAARGAGPARALLDACCDVYVKGAPTRALSGGVPAATAAAKQRLYQSMSSTLVQHESALHGREPRAEDGLSALAATPGAAQLALDAAQARVLQQGALLAALLGALALPPGGAAADALFLAEAVGAQGAGEPPSALQLLPPLLVVFYERATPHDAALRHAWLCGEVHRCRLRALRSGVDLEACRRFVGEASKAVLDALVSAFEVCDHLPWDGRWLLPSCPGGTANRAALAAVFAFLLQVEEAARSPACAPTTRSPPAKQRVITVAAYSEALSQGKLEDLVTSHPLVTQFGPLLRQLDAFIKAVLGNKQVEVTDSQWASLSPALAWRFRLAEQGSLQLVEEAGAHRVDSAIALLTLHFRWLMKLLLPTLELLAAQGSALKTSETMQDILKKINRALTSATSPLLRLGKKIRGRLGPPLPLSSEEQSTLAEKIQRLADLLQIWPSTDPGHIKMLAGKVEFLMTAEGQSARRNLAMALEGLRTDGQLSEVANLVKTVEALCDKQCFVRERCAVEGQFPEKEALMVSARVQLWPVQELMALVLTMLFQRRILSEAVAEKGNDPLLEDGSFFVGKTLHMLLTALPSVPVEVVVAVKRMMTAPKGPSSVLSEVLFYQLQHSKLSPARSLASLWLSWSPNVNTSSTEAVEELITDFEMKQDALPMHCPLMTSLVTNHVLAKDAALHVPLTDLVASTALGAQEATKHKLTAIRDLLWTNLNTLFSPALDFKTNDAYCALAASQLLLRSLNEILSDLSPEAKENGAAKKVEVYLSKDLANGVKEVQQLRDALQRLESVSSRLEVLLSEKEAQSEVDILISSGETWLLVGFLEILLLSKLGHFDPVTKKAIKLQYIVEDQKDTSRFLYARELQARLIGHPLEDVRPEDLHPFVTASRQRLTELTTHRKELEQNIAYRPPAQPYYSQLLRETSHYSNSLGSGEIAVGLLEKLLSAAAKLQDVCPSAKRLRHMAQQAEELLNEERVWRNSQLFFCRRLFSNYGLHFPDMVLPLLAAVEQLCRGTSLLATTVQKLLVRLKLKVPESMVKLVQFPSMLPRHGPLASSAGVCLDAVFTQQLQSLMPEGEEKSCLISQETYRLIKAGLEELRNICVAQGCVDATSWSLLVKLLSQMVRIWREQEDEKKTKEEDKSNWFRAKAVSHCENLTEEQQEALELKVLFPTTEEEDFGDIEAEPTLEQRTEKPPAENPSTNVVTEEDIHRVCQLHWDLVTAFSCTSWLVPAGVGVIRPNYISPLLQRFQTFRKLLISAAPGLDASVDHQLAPSLILLASVALQTGDGDVSLTDNNSIGSALMETVHRKPSDFYCDTNVEEVRQCLPVLDAVKKRVKELLREWPDHPTLNQILVVEQRIMSFPITSPVSRFLAGLELLLNKLREWEENAHSGVSIMAHMTLVTERIVAWRRLELQSWKDCLDNAAYKVCTSASRWWFFIFSVVESYAHESSLQQPPTQEEVIDSFQQLMEKSPLGEFQARLDMLYAFHCHATHLPSSTNQRTLVNILWNLHCYYTQFSQAVSAKILELRNPIEKKLKDFVKIARWSDINYWAIKQAVEKSRRTLLKFVREFEKILKQPVTPVLTNPHHESFATMKGVQSKQSLKKQSDFQPEYFMAPLQQMPSSDIFGESSPETLLPRAEKLFVKSRTLCSRVVAGAPYSTLVDALNELVEDMRETSVHLKNLEIPNDATLEKKKSVAKSHLQQRRKALTDAFRSLQQLGLSYRLGVTTWHNEEAARRLFDFTLPPLDLKASLEHLRSRVPDGLLKALWDGCDSSFYQSVARLSLLDSFLKNPHKDIGPPFIERLRGFNTHLLILANEQKKHLAESFYYLCSLRRQVSLVSALKEARETLPQQSELQHSLKQLKHLLTNILLCLEQFLMLLHACPVEPSSSFVIDLPGAQGEMSSATKGAPSWERAASKVRSIILSATKFRLSLTKSEQSLSQLEAPAVSSFEPPSQTACASLVVPSQYDLLCEGYNMVANFVEEIQAIRELFEGPSVSDDAKNPMTEALVLLEKSMQSDVARFKAVQTRRNSLKGFMTGTEMENKELEISQVPDNDVFIGENSFNESNEDVLNASWNVHISLSRKDMSPEERQVAVEEFRDKVESVLKISLILIEKFFKKYDVEKIVKERTQTDESSEEAKADDEGEQEDVVGLQENHLKEKLVGDLLSDVANLQMQKVDHLLNSLIRRFGVLLDLDNFSEEAENCKRFLLICIPCIEQLSFLYQFFVTQQASTYRATCRLLSMTLTVSIDLAQKGFCIPKDLMPEEDGEEAGDAKGGMGLGEGEGEKDVSDRIESQDQLEDARPEGEESKEEDKECKEEEKGVEMDEDFGGKLQDIEKKEGEDDSDSSGDEEEPDKEMGETEEGADNLDQEIWGSDSEEEGEDDDEKKQDPGQGKETGDPELGAKDDKRERKGDEEEEDVGGTEGRDEKKKDINEMNEPEVDEEQTDPYHGKQDPLPEPEPLDLPDDLQLDDGPEKEGEEEENPFDIDKMKEKQPPPPPEEDQKEGEEEAKDDPMGGLSDESEEEENVEKKEDAKKEEGEKEDGEGEGEEEEGKGEEKEKGAGEEEGDDEAQPTEKAMPSEDQPSQAPAEAAEMETNAAESSQDLVSNRQEQQQEMSGQQEPEDMGEEGGDEAQGVGQAQAEEQRSGHRGPLTTPKDKLPRQADQEPQPKQEKRQRPGESDSNRSLGDTTEPTKKRLKTIDIEKMDVEGAGGEEEDEKEKYFEENGPEEGKESDVYQHIKDAKESFDAQTLDAATKEQAEKQPVPKDEEEKSEEVTPEDDVDLHEDDDVATDEVSKLPVEKLGKKEGKQKKPSEALEEEEEEEERMETEVEVEGEQVSTYGPARGSETTFHTQYDIVAPDVSVMEPTNVDALRKELESQLASWAQPPADAEAAQTWQGFVSVTGGLARDLSEQLRLVLEPTQASRLRGDYRTGRRINMRKVIPYIASQFRKDKIWLRRTKPSKRDYQILLAIDDSSSMADNHTRELAFESLALMSQALTLLEAGELGVVSFGEQTRILHRLGDPFTEQSGARLLQEFSFTQKRTCVGQLVDFCSALLRESRGGRAGECAQLLLVVSDGRGVFSEGADRVRAAVRAARLQRLFIVFVVLDNPSAKDSILDIRVPVFQGTQLIGINSYLDTFPFPFYLILRDINCLPAVMSDALRQWFELVTNSDTQ